MLCLGSSATPLQIVHIVHIEHIVFRYDSEGDARLADKFDIT